MDYDIVGQLERLIEALKEYRPGDRSEKDRACAIVITDLEKALAYFKVYAA